MYLLKTRKKIGCIYVCMLVLLYMLILYMQSYLKYSVSSSKLIDLLV